MGEADVMPLLEARIYAYDLLRRTFLEEPPREFCQLLIEHDIVHSFPFIHESKLIKEGVNQVHKYLESSDVTNEENYQKLHWDFTCLFIGPHKLPSPPWESAYLNEERLLFQKETLEVRKYYLEYQFLPKFYGMEADDHIGLELDFMYHLSNCSVDQYKCRDMDLYMKAIDDQIAFLKKHLCRWIPAFSKDITQHASTDFYKGMSKVLKGFLELDLLALTELRGKVLEYC